MTMRQGNSIDLASFSKNVEQAVSELRAEKPDLFGPMPEIGFLPQPGIIGFIINDSKFRNRNFGEVTDIANLVGKKLAPVTGMETANVLLHKGNIIVGFFPANDLLKL